MSRRRKAELVEAKMLSPSVRSLTFRTADASSVGHSAGQHLDLFVPTARGFPFKRAYSIASAPDAAHPDRFEIAVTLVDGGPTSRALHELALGTSIEIEGPDGAFVRGPRDRAWPGLFVATGTGLAPLRAMLTEEVRDVQGPPLVLLFGCRTPNDLLWEDELRSWEKSCPRFLLHVTLSRAPPEWKGLTGYVQRHAVDLAATLPGARAYVCGIGAMVDDVVKLLERTAGIPSDALRYEVYD